MQRLFKKGYHPLYHPRLSPCLPTLSRTDLSCPRLSLPAHKDLPHFTYENHPFIARYCRIPYSDIAEIIQDHAQLISTCAIAERHDISPTTAAHLFHVVINSLTKRKCLNILPSRSPDKLYASILEYPLEERMKVKYVSIDLCMAFHKMVQTCFPNAQIVADHSSNNGALEEGTDLWDFHWAEQWIHRRMQYDNQDIRTTSFLIYPDF